MDGVGYDELVDVVDAATEQLRRGQVLEIDGDRIVVQVLGGTRGLDLPRHHGPAPRGEVARIAVGPGLRRPDPRRHAAGRSTAGRRSCRTSYRDLNGLADQPGRPRHPAEFIETGISAIDGLHTLVRGQKLPDLLRLRPARGRARRPDRGQAPACRGDDADDFVVVFAAIGVTQREAEFFRGRVRRAAAARERIGPLPQPRRRPRGRAAR